MGLGLIAAGLGLGGLVYAATRRSGPDSLSHLAADATTPTTPTTPVIVQTPTGPVVVQTPMGPPAPPTPIVGPSAGATVTTPPTAKEGSLTLRVVEPAKQPLVQAGAKQDQARAMASQLDAALKGNVDGSDYPTRNSALKSQVSTFQGLVGLAQDGLYGPQTAGALMYYLNGQPPPPPFFYSGERVIKVFRPRTA